MNSTTFFKSIVNEVLQDTLYRIRNEFTLNDKGNDIDMEQIDMVVKQLLEKPIEELLEQLFIDDESCEDKSSMVHKTKKTKKKHTVRSDSAKVRSEIFVMTKSVKVNLDQMPRGKKGQLCNSHSANIGSGHFCYAYLKKHNCDVKTAVINGLQEYNNAKQCNYYVVSSVNIIELNPLINHTSVEDNTVAEINVPIQDETIIKTDLSQIKKEEIKTNTDDKIVDDELKRRKERKKLKAEKARQKAEAEEQARQKAEAEEQVRQKAEAEEQVRQKAEAEKHERNLIKTSVCDIYNSDSEQTDEEQSSDSDDDEVDITGSGIIMIPGEI